MEIIDLNDLGKIMGIFTKELSKSNFINDLQTNEKLDDLNIFLNNIFGDSKQPKKDKKLISFNLMSRGDILKHFLEYEDKEGYFVIKIIDQKNKPKILNTLDEIKKYLCNNRNPFILEDPFGFYYVRQKKNKLVFHGKEKRFVLKTNVEYSKKHLNFISKKIRSVAPFHGFDDIIETFNIKNDKSKLDLNLFLKNILIDNPDVEISRFEVDRGDCLDTDFCITISSTNNDKIYDYMQDYLKNLKFDENFKIYMS